MTHAPFLAPLAEAAVPHRLRGRLYGRASGLSEAGRRSAVGGALAAIAALAVANFNAGIIAPSSAAAQGVAVLLLWAAIILGSLVIHPRRRIAFGTETIALLAFYGFTLLSVLWSDLSAQTLLKATALTITTLGAWRLACVMSVDEVVGWSSLGLFAVAAASIFTVVFVPSVGIDDTYFHKGQWQGLFESKQSLGTVGAILAVFAFHRLVTIGGRWQFALVFGTALACVLGSGSRGGAALAVFACLSLVAARRSSALARLLAFGPVLMTGLAILLVAYLYIADQPYLLVGGEKIDFTERAIIWHYALSHFDTSPLVGFGLNGFWSIPEVYHEFERQHGWVLDNYHDGYIGIVVETGIIGITLFAASTLLFALKLGSLALGGAMARSDVALIIGFVNMIYFIDFTETFFLRSTNVNAVLLLIFLFIACGGGAEGRDRRRRVGDPVPFPQRGAR